MISKTPRQLSKTIVRLAEVYAEGETTQTRRIHSMTRLSHYTNLYRTPTKGENSNDNEHQPRDSSSSTPAFGADAIGTPEPDEHANVKEAYEHQWQQVAHQEKRHLE